MKKNILKVTLVAAFALVAGYNVYTSQKSSDVMSDLALANVEALASSSEGPGWRGYYTDWDAGCCRRSPISSNECRLSPCPGEY